MNDGHEVAQELQEFLEGLGIQSIIQVHNRGPLTKPVVIHLSHLDTARLVDYLVATENWPVEDFGDRPWGNNGPRYCARAAAEREQDLARARIFQDY